MTKDQARIVLLEEALRQAQYTVSFLHGCLTDDKYSYAYPDQTLRHLKEWEELVPPGRLCIHSRHVPDECDSCKEHIEQMNLKADALRVLE